MCILKRRANRNPVDDADVSPYFGDAFILNGDALNAMKTQAEKPVDKSKGKALDEGNVSEVIH